MEDEVATLGLAIVVDEPCIGDAARAGHWLTHGAPSDSLDSRFRGAWNREIEAIRRVMRRSLL